MTPMPDKRSPWAPAAGAERIGRMPIYPGPGEAETERLLGDGTGLLLPGVTTFIKEGAPNIAARVMSTNARLGQLKQILEEMLGNGGTTSEAADNALSVAKRYPRVLAHVNDITNVRAPESGLPPRGSFTPAERPGTGTMFLRSSGNKTVDNTVAHELTHAAQNVALKRDFMPSYMKETVERGYKGNRFEVAANAAARKRAPLPEGDWPSKLAQMLGLTKP